MIYSFLKIIFFIQIMLHSWSQKYGIYLVPIACYGILIVVSIFTITFYIMHFVIISHFLYSTHPVFKFLISNYKDVLYIYVYEKQTYMLLTKILMTIVLHMCYKWNTIIDYYFCLYIFL